MHVCTYVWVWTLNKLKSFQNMCFEVIKQVTWSVIKQLTKQVNQNVLIASDKKVFQRKWRRRWQPTPVFLPGKIPWMEEPGALQSMGSQRVGHDWVTSLSFLSKKIQTFCLQMLIPIFLNHFPSSVETMKRKIYPLFIIPKDFIL